MDDARKPPLPIGGVLQMNLGFLGLQFSFGLQQSSMGPIYSYLGAREASLPLLFLAGPLTGLIVQPLIGALSDRTVSRFGRRTPYFLVGAVLCSLSLAAMPFSRTLVQAACLLWVLDAANNVTMEPYRAYVSDRLPSAQRQIGFLTQSAFTGLAQTLAYITPSLLVLLGLNRDALDRNGVPAITRTAFLVGAVLSISTILWSVIRVQELPLSAQEAAYVRARPASLAATFVDLRDAVAQMPQAMRRMALMCLFQWGAIAVYWTYVIYALSRSVFGTADPHTAGFRDAVLLNGEIGAFFNLIAFAAAFAMTPVVRRAGPRWVHAGCLLAAALAMVGIGHLHSRTGLFGAAVGLGVGWASMMANPYVMLADSVPPERTGTYMGLFNVFIVVPMLLLAGLMPLIYDRWLGGDARNALTLAGALMACGAAATLWVRTPRMARGVVEVNAAQ